MSPEDANRGGARGAPRGWRCRSASAPAIGRPGLDRLLRWLAVDPALSAADNPLEVIVRELASVLGTDWVFVGECQRGTPATVRIAAWWRDGKLHEPVQYPIAGSPCERACQGVPYCCGRHVDLRFPNASIQRTEGIQAYAAHPLTPPAGPAPIGLIGVMSRRPFHDTRRIRRFLAACAPRVAGELWRGRSRAGPEGLAMEQGTTRTREKRLLGLVREREVLLREVHHRVKGNLQIVASLLAMQGDASEDAALRQTLAEAVSRVSAIALVHAQLSEHPARGSVDMKALVEQVTDSVRRTLDGSSPGVTITLALEPLRLPLRLAVPCGLLIAELVTNASRHAFAGRSRGEILVRLDASADMVAIVVRDDGRWQAADAAGGLGLRLIHLLATRQLGGDLSVDHAEGTTFTVRFPYDARAEGLDEGGHPTPEENAP